MKLKLADLKPNPVRDFKIDPVDQDHVATIAKSINDHGFWGGVTARRNDDGDYEVAGGWHRVKAGVKAQIAEADIFVGKFARAEMRMIYAMENATQRGANSSTSIAGSVAAALREHLQEEILAVEINSQNGGDKGRHGVGREAVLEKLASVPGINENIVRQQLANLKASGHYDRIAREVADEYEAQQAVELARIAEAKAKAQAEERRRVEAAEASRKAAEERTKRAAEVKAAQAAERQAKEAAEKRRAAERKAEAQRKAAEADRKAEIARKEAQARAAAARSAQAKADEEAKLKPALEAKKAKAQATKAKIEEKAQPITFDMTGVSAHLKNQSHVETFRRLVTAPQRAKFLPVENQAKVAKELVDLAAKRRAEDIAQKKVRWTELTADFIENELDNLMALSKMVQGTVDKEAARKQAEELARASWITRWRTAEDELNRFASGVANAVGKMTKLRKERPPGIELTKGVKFELALHHLLPAIRSLQSFSEPEAIEAAPVIHDETVSS